MYISDRFKDLDAEKAFLGSIIFDTKAMDSTSDLVHAADFADKRNSIIFGVIRDLYGKGLKTDLVTLVAELTSRGLLESAGGADYAAALTDTVCSGANVMYFADKVRAYSQRRMLISFCRNTLEESNDEGKENREIVDKAAEELYKIQTYGTGTKIYTAEEMCTGFSEDLKMRMEIPGGQGVRTGIDGFDRLTGGFQKGEMSCIAARPSLGKTSLALSMAKNMIEEEVPVGFLSLETGRTPIAYRIISMYTDIPSNKLRSGFLSAAKQKSVYEANEELAKKKFFITDTPNLPLDELKAAMRRMVVHCGAGILFIDYIGLVRLEGRELKEYEKQSIISKEIKALARELCVPVIALCQLNRDAESGKPTLANIRGSGSIEQDADLVIFIEGERNDGREESERKLVIEKNRNGPTGEVAVIFRRSTTLYMDKPVI